ncbi:MAG: amino acid adenylation domain-containing protein [Cyanobium sp.]
MNESKPSMIHASFMDQALAAAAQASREGEAPFGACLVKGKEVIACEPNRVRSQVDVTAHAEINVLRQAFRRLHTTNLSGCILYTTCEPCPMCFAACHDAKISTIVFGADLAAAERAGFPGFAIATESLQRSALVPISLIAGVRREACLRLLNSPAGSPPSDLFSETAAGGGSGNTARALPLAFLEQARRRPEAMALSCPDNSLTYGELAARSLQLAQRLRSRGVARNQVVAISLPRSSNTILAILGVLLAGAAYLHIAPEYPRERRRFLLEDAAANWLITEDGIDIPPLPATTALIDLHAIVNSAEATEQTTSGETPEVEDPIIGLEDLAYLMYTSGSTGAPTGVMVSHGNIARLFPALGERFQPLPSDRWTCCHPASFGFSVWEIWGALAHGGELVMVPQATVQSSEALLELVRKRAITVLSLTPTAFRMFDWAEESSRSTLPLELRCIAFSGEPLPGDVVRPWIQRHGDRVPLLINTYALTETSGQVTLQPINREDLLAGEANLIGIPLEDITIRLLDREGFEVSPGQSGELYVGGPAVAQGYWHRPELTAQRFVELETNPHHPGSGRMRFFRTGDLARQRPDGRLDFLGRLDRQVKRDGFRIEPEEIEATLRSHPSVRDALVVVNRTPGKLEIRLDAYVVPANGDGDVARIHQQESGCEIWPSLGEYQIYDSWLYTVMGLELERHQRFRDLINHSVRDRVVADLGTGDQALLARLCVEAGARKVYAIEVLPEPAAAARALVEKLGLTDRIIVISGDAAELELPELVDLVISRLMGNIGSSDGMIPLYRRARRWLAPGGRFLPERFVTRMAAITLPENLRQNPSFSTEAIPYIQQIFDLQGGPFDLRLCLRQLPTTALLSTTAEFEDLNFSGDPADANEQTATLVMLEAGIIDGIVLWLEVWDGGEQIADYLHEQVGWLPVYLPLFDPGLELVKGDELVIRCWRHISSMPPFPEYGLEGEVLRGQTVLTRFSHFTGHGTPTAGSNPFHARLLAKLNSSEQPTHLSRKELHRFLSDRLPAYLRPSSLTTIEALPMTANGKVDLGALPRAVPERPELDQDFEGSRTPQEAELIRIWEDLLEMRGIGIHDKFFELGGNSLLAVQMMNLISQRFSLELRLRDLFDRPTIARLSEVLPASFSPAEDDGRSELLALLREMTEEEAERLLGMTTSDSGEA